MLLKFVLLQVNSKTKKEKKNWLRRLIRIGTSNITRHVPSTTTKGNLRVKKSTLENYKKR